MSDFSREWNNYNGSASGTSIVFDTTDTAAVDGGTTYTFELPDPLIDWLPYKIEKYLPTWHLVRSYQH